MFGTKHIIIIICCVIYILGLLLILKKYKPSLRLVVRVLLAIGVCSETFKVFTYIIINEQRLGGYLPKTDLPLHLCSVQILFMLLLVLSSNEKLKRVLYAFMLPTCLIGGVAAILIPTSSSLSVPVITLQYFLYHSSIVVYAIYLYMTSEIKFEFRDYISSLLMLFAVFFVAIYLNSVLNDYSSPINFMYVVNPPVDGLPYLNKNQGWLVYILRYALLAAVCITLCYIKPVAGKLKSICHKCGGNNKSTDK